MAQPQESYPHFDTSDPLESGKVWSDEENWTTGVAWVRENFKWICRKVSGYRPVPYVIELKDLRQLSYLMAFVTLQELQRKDSLHLFVPHFYKKLSWEIKATYPPIIREPESRIEDVSNPDPMDFLPGWSWPTRLNSRLKTKALGVMRVPESKAWADYLEGVIPSDGTKKRRFYKNLSAGIDRVLAKIGRGGVDHG